MRDRFCDECGVSRDLHRDPDDPTALDCYSAEMKARTIDSFYGIFIPKPQLSAEPGTPLVSDVSVRGET